MECNGYKNTNRISTDFINCLTILFILLKSLKVLKI